MRGLVRAVGVAVAAAVIASACSGMGDVAQACYADRPAGSGQLPIVVLESGSHRVCAEVAFTAPQRQTGLMFRTALPDDHGMLFVFPEHRDTGFWMMNTLIPLSIAYMQTLPEGGGYRIVRVLDMQPCVQDPCPTYPPGVSYDAALEVNQGWFDSARVGRGDVVRVAAGTVPPAL